MLGIGSATVPAAGRSEFAERRDGRFDRRRIAGAVGDEHPVDLAAIPVGRGSWRRQMVVGGTTQPLHSPRSVKVAQDVLRFAPESRAREAEWTDCRFPPVSSVSAAVRRPFTECLGPGPPGCRDAADPRHKVWAGHRRRLTAIRGRARLAGVREIRAVGEHTGHHACDGAEPAVIARVSTPVQPQLRLERARYVVEASPWPGSSECQAGELAVRRTPRPATFLRFDVLVIHAIVPHQGETSQTRICPLYDGSVSDSDSRTSPC